MTGSRLAVGVEYCQMLWLADKSPVYYAYEHITFDIAVDTDLGGSGYPVEVTVIRIGVMICVLASLPGCAAYTVANGVAYIATDKSLTDHASSTLVSADCDAVRVVQKGTYYCETRDIGVTYNRNRF